MFTHFYMLLSKIWKIKEQFTNSKSHTIYMSPAKSRHKDSFNLIPNKNTPKYLHYTYYKWMLLILSPNVPGTWSLGLRLAVLLSEFPAILGYIQDLIRSSPRTIKSGMKTVVKVYLECSRCWHNSISNDISRAVNVIIQKNFSIPRCLREV